MKKHPFVGSRCRDIVDWHGSQYETRIEIRSDNRKESLYSRTLEKLCKSCAVQKMNELKGLAGAEQGSLL